MSGSGAERVGRCRSLSHHVAQGRMDGRIAREQRPVSEHVSGAVQTSDNAPGLFIAEVKPEEIVLANPFILYITDA